MFESPLDWCPFCKEWVALDEPLEECARRHGWRPEDCAKAPLFRFAAAALAEELARRDAARK